MKRISGVLALSVLVACAAPPARPAAEASTTVQVSSLAEPAAPVAPFLGVVAAHERVALSYPAAVRLGHVYVQLGQEVAAGERLADIDTTELERDLAAAEAARREARAQVRAAQAASRQARNEARQLDELCRRGMVSIQEASNARLAAERARAAVDEARAQADQRDAALAKLRDLHARRELRAPMAGRVLARGFDAGALVPPTAAIVTVGSAALDVRFAVPPERVAALHVGSAVSIVVDDRVLAGHVSALGSSVDTAMQLVVGVASVDPGAELPPAGTRVGVRPAAR